MTASPTFRRALAPALAGLALCALSACDGVGRPAADDAAKARPVRPVAAVEHDGPIVWNPKSGGFEYRGLPLRAEKLWTFEGATDGFVLDAGDFAPAQGQGLILNFTKPFGSLRSPSGLHVEGSNRPYILVRLTRLKPGKNWDGRVYYSTPSHGETLAYYNKPLSGGDPPVNETVVLAYDMHALAAGGGDWKSSKIEQVRIDLDGGSGGAFLIREVAIAQSPQGAVAAAQPKPPPRQPTLTLPDRPAAEKVADLEN